MRASFDFETWDWVNPLCCGIMWGPPQARDCAFIRDNGEGGKWNPDAVVRRTLQVMAGLVQAGTVKEFWAHNGGKFDALFLAKGAADLGWEISAHMAGTRAIYLGIRAGRGKDAPLIRVYDSYAVASASLKRNAEDWELPSRKLFGDTDYSKDMREQEPGRLREGCLIDCQLVLELLEKVESLIEDWGGKLKSTFSSSALSIMKAALKEDGLSIPSHEGLEHYQDIARQSFAGGRVEVIHHSPNWLLSEWDVNSSYPWSMSQVLPWEPLGQAQSASAIERILEGDREGIVRATVRVPSCYIPPLPFKVPDAMGGGLFFPTGTWDAWFAAPELRYARSLGCVVKPTDAIAYRGAQPFKEILGKMFALKASASGAVRSFTKFCLNGSYGKWAQAPERQVLKVFSTEEEGVHYLHSRKPGTCANVCADRRFLVENSFRWPKHTHFAMASYITAYSRILLHKAMLKTAGLAYVDTDATHGRAIDDCIPQGKELGQFKLELKDYKGKFYAPKIYHLTEKDGKEHFAAKGFTMHHAKKGDPVDSEVFAKIVQGEQVARGMIRGLRGQVRHGNNPERLIDKKTWAGKSTKRRAFPNGETFPWSATELLRGAHLDSLSPIARKSP